MANEVNNGSHMIMQTKELILAHNNCTEENFALETN